MSGMTLNVSPDLVKPVIEEKIQAAIVSELCKGDQNAIIGAAVASVLNQKVDSDGKPTTYSYHTTSYIQWLANKAIRESAQKAIAEWIEKKRPEFEKHFQKELSKNAPAMTKAFVDGLMGSIKNSWSFKVDVAFDSPKS